MKALLVCLAAIFLGPFVMAAELHVLDLPDVVSVAYCQETNKLYAIVSDKGTGTTPNSVIQINPKTGAIEQTCFVGSQPSQLVVSAGGNYLYVLVSGSHAIRQVNLSPLKAGLQIPADPTHMLHQMSRDKNNASQRVP